MPTKILKPAQVKQAREKLEGLEKAIKAPSVPGFPDDKTGIITQARKTKELLDGGEPEPTTPQSRDELLREAKTLETEIRNGMPTRIHMERKVHGVVDQNRVWGLKNTHNISRWKDIWRTLEPDNFDPDLSNIERIRPLGREDEAVPRRMYSGVDVVDGEIVPEGIPDAEKIEARTSTTSKADSIISDLSSSLSKTTIVENMGGGGHTAPSIVENMIAAETPEVVKPAPVPESCDVCGEEFEKGWRAVSSHKRFGPCGKGGKA